MLTEPITVERDGHVLLIGVNRPAKRNAFNLAAIEALGGAYESLGTDDELRAGVLFAHGDHFSAGLDLAEVGPAVAEHGPEVLCGSHRFDPFAVWRDPVPKPVVMAVNGIAFTLSIELALAADIVIAADDVRFRQLEIGRGIMPFGGATFRAPAQLGWGNAMHSRSPRTLPCSAPCTTSCSPRRAAEHHEQPPSLRMGRRRRQNGPGGG